MLALYLLIAALLVYLAYWLGFRAGYTQRDEDAYDAAEREGMRRY